MPGVAGVMPPGYKGSNCIMGDRPVICDTKVRCIGDPVAAVAAETGAGSGGGAGGEGGLRLLPNAIRRRKR